MIYLRNIHTFLRHAAVALRWARGERAHRLTSVVAGLLPDMITESVRLAARYTMPLVDTPLDALGYLLRDYGLPSYEETYAATLARLRDAWPTHEVAGARAMLEREAARCGLADPVVVVEPESAFCLETTSATAPAVWGGFDWGDGTLLGSQIPQPAARNLLRMMRVFRPARERFTGVCEVT
jgi:hypothetical protein